MNGKRLCFGAAIVGAVLTLSACNPQQLINDYFASLGLNPLAIVRDDIQPGALFISDGRNTVYTDSIYSFSSSAAPAAPPKNLDSSFQAVLHSYESDRTVKASAALDFLKSVLPVNIGADLGLTGIVTINAIDAKGRRLPVSAVIRYLANNSKPLRQFIKGQGHVKAYVAYEVYQATTLNIVAQNGGNVSDKIAVSQNFKPLSSGTNLGFTYARTSKDTLVIKGSHPYVFAVRTGELVYQNGAYTLRVTNFANGQVKAAGGNEAYSAPMRPGFAPISASPLKRRAT